MGMQVWEGDYIIFINKWIKYICIRDLQDRNMSKLSLLVSSRVYTQMSSSQVSILHKVQKHRIKPEILISKFIK